jgi:ABC-2 type transport system ATP-binding protein
MIEVWSENARAALEPVRRMDGVHSVSLYGDRLHIALEKKTDGAGIIARLRREGIDVKDFRDILPSLEDVFISMVEK